MRETNYYDILGVAVDADKDQIKKAYREAARRYHPDLNKTAGSEELFKLIQEAYEVLIDEAKRSTYDQDIFASRNKAYNNQSTQENSNYWDTNTSEPVYDDYQHTPKTSLDFLSKVRIVVGIIFIVILPISEFVGKPDLVNHLIIYYGWIIFFYMFTKVIFVITSIGLFFTFITGLIHGDGGKVLGAVIGFFVASLLAYIIRPSMFKDENKA